MTWLLSINLKHILYVCVSEASATTTEMSLVFCCTVTIKLILILESKLPSHFHDYHPSFPFFDFSFFITSSSPACHITFLPCSSLLTVPLSLLSFLFSVTLFFVLILWCSAVKEELHFPLWCSWVLVTQSCLWITEFPSSFLRNGPIQYVFSSKKKRSTKGS